MTNTLRTALKQIRESLEGEDRTNVITEKLSDGTYLQVESTPASDGGILLGSFRFRRTSDPAGYERPTSWRTL